VKVMASLEIITYPDERLKQVAQPVERFDEALRRFVERLEQTMRHAPGGVGIAAPQVGHLFRIAIVDVSSRPKIASNGRMVLINPEILSWEGMVKGREGCMSVPDFAGVPLHRVRGTGRAARNRPSGRIAVSGPAGEPPHRPVSAQELRQQEIGLNGAVASFLFSASFVADPHGSPGQRGRLGTVVAQRDRWLVAVVLPLLSSAGI